MGAPHDRILFEDPYSGGGSRLRAYALEFEDPATALAKLDRKAQHFERNILATCQYAVVAAALDRVHISSAGHPSPMLARPGRPSETVELPADLPLGVSLDLPRSTVKLGLSIGSVACFYTDGLVERRGEALDVGIERLGKWVTAAAPEAVSAENLLHLVGAGPISDDVALVVLRRSADNP